MVSDELFFFGPADLDSPIHLDCYIRYQLQSTKGHQGCHNLTFSREEVFAVSSIAYC